MKSAKSHREQKLVNPRKLDPFLSLPQTHDVQVYVSLKFYLRLFPYA